MWVEFNNNPCGRRVGDCAVRAVSVALDLDWEEAYERLTRAGFWMCDMPSSDSVVGALLRGAGFYREAIDDRLPEYYSAEDFCKDHPKGIYVLAFGGHMAGVRDGCLYDSWDSSREVPAYYWARND